MQILCLLKQYAWLTRYECSYTSNLKVGQVLSMHGEPEAVFIILLLSSEFYFLFFILFSFEDNRVELA